jgi:hypothetical protein
MTTCVLELEPANVGLLVDESKTTGVGKDAEMVLQQLRQISAQYLRAPAASASFLCGVDAIFEAAADASQENWDGRTARPVSPDATINAIKLLTHLPSTAPVPDAYARPNGALVLEWGDSPERTFAVSLSGAGDLSFSGYYGLNDRIFGKIPSLTDELPDGIREGLRRVYRD